MGAIAVTNSARGVAVTDNFSYISYSTNFESKAKVN